MKVSFNNMTKDYKELARKIIIESHIFIRDKEDLYKFRFEVKKAGKSYKSVESLAAFLKACDEDEPSYITAVEVAEIAANGGATFHNGDVWYAYPSR